MRRGIVMPLMFPVVSLLITPLPHSLTIFQINVDLVICVHSLTQIQECRRQLFSCLLSFLPILTRVKIKIRLTELNFSFLFFFSVSFLFPFSFFFPLLFHYCGW